MKFMAMAAALAAVLAAAPAVTQAAAPKKIQCWTDKNGQRMCGDRIPPEYAGEKRDVMKEGRVVDTIDASKTEDERKAELARKKAEEEQRKRAEQDRALLEMYRSQNDIVAMRDERLALIDSRTQAAEKNATDTDKSLAGLRARADAQQQKEGKVDDKLAKQIKSFEKSQEQNKNALERYRKERETLQEKFDRDYMRYAELRGLPTSAPPPPPARAVEAEPPKKDAKPGATPATKAKPADPKAGEPAAPAEPATPPKKG
jgi:hypothetical protein